MNSCWKIFFSEGFSALSVNAHLASNLSWKRTCILLRDENTIQSVSILFQFIMHQDIYQVFHLSLIHDGAIVSAFVRAILQIFKTKILSHWYPRTYIKFESMGQIISQKEPTLWHIVCNITFMEFQSFTFVTLYVLL